MKNIRKTMESAMREGLTLDEVCQIAAIIADNITKEQEKEEQVLKARGRAAEALCDYVNLMAGKSIAHVESAIDILEVNSELFLELFETEADGEPEVKVLSCEEFNNLIERLGLET